jgi:hypothetical protein
MDKQKRVLDRMATGRSPAPNRDRHRDSSFILKGILRSKQGNHPMSGRKTGPEGKRKRYYGVSKAINTPKKGSVLAKLIPAEPIEKTVLAVVRSILLDSPNLREMIDTEVRHQYAELQGDHADLGALHEEKRLLEKTLCDTIGMLSKSGRESAAPAIRQLDGQIAEITERIAQAEYACKLLPKDIDAHVEAVVSDLKQLGASLDTPTPQLRRLLGALISRATVDLETREVDLELSLPSWASEDSLPLCLDDCSACKTTHEAQHANRLILAQKRLIWDGKSRSYSPEDVEDAA